jgi:hypothetical protein
MKTRHLLSGVAVIAALAFSARVGAQVINPGNANPGGNAMGMPGPNPGGPTDAVQHGRSSSGARPLG